MKGIWLWIIGVVAVAAIAIGVVVATKNNSNKNQTTSNTSTSNSSQSSSSDSSTSKAPTSADKVTIQDSSFSPAHITVKKGTKVTWTNNDSMAHTVSGDSSPGPDSGNLQNGESYSFTFDTVGTFGYHCNIHQSMHGTVTVTE